MEMQGWYGVEERAARNEQGLDDFGTIEDN